MRAAWRATVAEEIAPERLVFVDECGTHTSMAPIYGYAPKGERGCALGCRESGARTQRCYLA